MFLSANDSEKDFVNYEFFTSTGGSEGCSPSSDHSPTLLDAPSASSDPSDDHLPSAGIIPEVSTNDWQ